MLKELGRSVLVYGLASGISKFIGIFLIPIFSRAFDPEQFGRLDLISTVISMVAILGMLQLESAISRFYFEVEGEKRKVYISSAFWCIFLLSGLLVILIFLLAAPISFLLFGSYAEASIFRHAAINILLFNLFGFFTVLLRFYNRPWLYTLVIFTQFFLTAMVSIILIYSYDTGILAFFYGQIAGLSGGLLIMLILFKNTILIRMDRSVLREFFAYSLPQVPAVMGNWLNSYANRFIMVSQMALPDIGLYTVAMKVASVYNLLDSAFRMAWEPFIWKRIGAPGHQQFLRSVSGILTIFVFGAALLLAVFAKELILILSTIEYIHSVPVVKLILAALTFPLLNQIYGLGASIAKKTMYNTYSFLIGLAFNLILTWLLIPWLEIEGVAISIIIGNMITLLLMSYFSEKVYRVGYAWVKFILLTVLFMLFIFGITIWELNIVIRVIMALALMLIMAFYGRSLIKSIA